MLQYLCGDITTCSSDHVQSTRSRARDELDTHFDGDRTVHLQHDDSDNEDNGRPVARTEFWEQDHMLGKGGFGEVWLQSCTNGNSRHKHWAVKTVSTQGKHKNYQRELEAIAKFSQRRYAKCFVKLLGWYEKETMLCIAMEYFPLGDLQTYMETHDAMPEADTSFVTFQILEGLEWMHQEHYAHRDIKPANILIKAQPPRSWWVKISDFGISKRIVQSNATTTIGGNLAYMAPEVLEYDPSSQIQLDHQAADMWSLGEMVFRMLTMTPVFTTYRTRMQYIMRPDLFPSSRLTEKGISENGLLLITSLMQPTPEARLRSDQALSHQWFDSYRTEPAPSLSPEVPHQLAEHLSLDKVSTPVQVSRDDPWATRSTRLSTYLEQFTPGRGDRGVLSDVSQTVTEIENLHFTDLNIAQDRHTLKGHSSSVISVAFSSDSRQVVSGSGDGSVKVWDAATGQCQQTCKGHNGYVYAVAFTSNSREIISGSADRTIKRWHTRTGKCLGTLRGHNDSIISVAVSHDNLLVLSGSADHTIKLWNAATGECLQTCKGHSGSVNSVAFTNDRVQIVSGSADRTINIWDAVTGNCQQTFQGHSDSVNSIGLNGHRLISGSADCTIRIWDLVTNRCNQILEGHSNYVYSVAFSSDSLQIISGSADCTVKVWDRITGDCQQTLKGYSGSGYVYSIALSSDGRQLVLGHYNCAIKVYQHQSKHGIP